MLTNLLLLGIFLLLAVGLVTAFLGWKRVSTYLTWNARYISADYEQAVTTRKPGKPAGEPSKTEQNGRAIKPVDDLVDLADMNFEDGIKAVEEYADGA